MLIYIYIFIIIGKKIVGETSGNSRSTSPILDNDVMKFTPTGLYFLPECVKLLLPPAFADSQHHSN